MFPGDTAAGINLGPDIRLIDSSETKVCQLIRFVVKSWKLYTSLYEVLKLILRRCMDVVPVLFVMLNKPECLSEKM